MPIAAARRPDAPIIQGCRDGPERRDARWQKVAKLGHEIGDHTENHPCGLRRFQRTQIAPMERFPDANFGAADHRVYAYPCGYIGLGRGAASQRFGRYTALLSKTFVAARTTSGEPLDPRSAWADRLHLPGFEPTYDQDDPPLAFAYLRTAIRDRRWAILVFHDSSPSAWAKATLA